ncbi:hypothetical protein MBLNU230_g2073t1 [Neophaeotheca triangularis]
MDRAASNNNLPTPSRETPNQTVSDPNVPKSTPRPYKPPPSSRVPLKSPPASPATTSLSTPAHIRTPHSVYRLQPERPAKPKTMTDSRTRYGNRYGHGHGHGYVRSHGRTYRDPSARRRRQAALGETRVSRQTVVSAEGEWGLVWEEEEGESDGGSDGGGSEEGGSWVGEGGGVFGSGRDLSRELELEGEEGRFAPRGTMVEGAWEGVGTRVGGFVWGVGEGGGGLGLEGSPEGSGKGSSSCVVEVGSPGERGGEGMEFGGSMGEGDCEDEGSDLGNEDEDEDAPLSLPRSGRNVSLPLDSDLDELIGDADISDEREDPTDDDDDLLSIAFTRRIATLPLDSEDLETSEPLTLDFDPLQDDGGIPPSGKEDDNDESTPLHHFPTRHRSRTLAHPYRDSDRTPSPTSNCDHPNPRPHRASSLPLGLAPPHRQLSNLAAEDTLSQRHRDSFELIRSRLRGGCPRNRGLCFTTIALNKTPRCKTPETIIHAPTPR